MMAPMAAAIPTEELLVAFCVWTVTTVMKMTSPTQSATTKRKACQALA